jgi:hypothetical protein
MENTSTYRTVALLPTGATINPAAPQGAEYYDKDQVAYIVRKVGRSTGAVLPEANALRVLTSYGNLGGAWMVGTRHNAQHDQTGRDLGRFEVVGVVTFADPAAATGEIPGRKVKHWVFK